MAIIFLLIGSFLYYNHQIYAKDENKTRKILYYRNPMNPSITSPAFMKDSMGMDYIPVYEDEEGSAGDETLQEPTVKIRENQQQLIGVKTEPIKIRSLMRMIRTVAKIAFDPELYKTEAEFIQAMKMKEGLKLSQSSETIERANALVEAAVLKLKLQGLSEAQIEELKAQSESDRGLLISDEKTPYAWAYGTIYEYDINAVKIGGQITLKTVAYPEEEFSGNIKAIDSVLDPNTRSVRIRALIDNPESKLKPNMYGDIFIHLDLGEQLAVPSEAVLDTGLRKIAYLDLGKEGFKAQEVEIGPQAVALVEGQERKFFPVLKGLKENDIVVTSGAFLIDSQSQLTTGISALWGGATEMKQESNEPKTEEIKTQHRH